MNHPEPIESQAIQSVPQPETEIAPPEAAPAPSADAPDQGGILDQIMESVQSMPEPPEYEQEISQ